MFLSSLLSCSTVLCLFDYVVRFWANKYDDDDDDDDEGKTNFRGARNSLMVWTDWPRPFF